jgi:hypothetical protein
VIGIVVGPDAWTKNTLPERQRNIIHKPAQHWLGPACNFGHDPAEQLVTGQQVDADAVTCWRCRHPEEAAQLDAERAARRAAWERRGAA